MQGFNMGRYVPPDVEGTTSGNKLHGKRPPGVRGGGALTVRFEMPYAIWCSACPKPTIIGQGVRFNAEKRHVGSYFTTPIFQFRMRHADCGGAIEIRTDPKNTAYVVVSGAKKRDTGDDDNAMVVGLSGTAAAIVTDEERARLRSSAFASLEKTIEDRQQLVRATERLDELEDASRRLWDDPYSRNKALRRTFRVGRRERERDAAAGEALRDRMGLGIELVPATEEDAQRAALIDFGLPPPGYDDGNHDDSAGKALAKPLFSSATATTKTTATKTAAEMSKKPTAKPPKGVTKAELLASRRRDDIVSEIVGNTRMARDPFLLDARTGRASVKLSGLKRKRQRDTTDEVRRTEEGGENDDNEENTKSSDEDGRSRQPTSKALVLGYDSDSD